MCWVYFKNFLCYYKNNMITGKEFKKGNASIYLLFGIFIIIGIGIIIGVYFFISQKQEFVVIQQENSTLDKNNQEKKQNTNPNNENMKQKTENKENNANDNQTKSENTIALISTNFGDIKLKLFDKDAPNTVQNFVKLSKSGFYDNVKFHRVIKGFMIQSGDPNSKDNNWLDDGTGGPGYSFPDEINSHKIINGTLAMANSGPNTNGSQFFILTGESAPWLDGKHTVFGEIIEGMDIVLKIENIKTDKSKNDHPIQDIIIKKIEIK